MDRDFLVIRLEDYAEMLHLRHALEAALRSRSPSQDQPAKERCQLILCLIFQRVRRFLLPIFLLRLGLAMYFSKVRLFHCYGYVLTRIMQFSTGGMCV